MSYNALANEIVIQIVKLIRSKDVENFAIVDKRTYNLSYDRLEKLTALRRNAKTMVSRFDSRFPSLGIYGLPSRHAYISSPIANEKDHYSGKTNSTLAGSEYLELNGDLNWLQPVIGSRPHVWDRGEPASKEHLDRLVLSAMRVGVEIPQAFLTFMGSKELLERMFLGGDWISLGPSLVKCDPEDDKGGGGYVIRFLCDQQSCRFWFLYVAPGGYHGVLRSAGDHDVHCDCLEEYPGYTFDDHPTPKLYKGVPFACERLYLEIASLESPSFELWLAFTYFSGYRSAAGIFDPALVRWEASTSAVN